MRASIHSNARVCVLRECGCCVRFEIAEMSLRPGRKQEERKKDYKGIPNYDEQRRKREEQVVEIRKTKREESLQKKRREGHHEASTSNAPVPSSNHSAEQLRNLPQLKAAVSSDDPSAQLDATRQFRKLLSIGASPNNILASYFFLFPNMFRSLRVLLSL